MVTHQLGIEDLPRTQESRAKKWLVVGLIVLGAMVLAAAILLAVKWPFTKERVVRRLQEATATTVKIGGFTPKYFPRPGCVAQQVTFQQKPGGQPLMTIRHPYHPRQLPGAAYQACFVCSGGGHTHCASGFPPGRVFGRSQPERQRD